METTEKRSKIGTNLMEIGNQSSASGSSQGMMVWEVGLSPDHPNPFGDQPHTPKPVVKKNSLLAKRKAENNRQVLRKLLIHHLNSYFYKPNKTPKNKPC